MNYESRINKGNDKVNKLTKMEKYSPKKTESKWQKYWEGEKFYQAKDFDKRPKKYLLAEFPYPSGDGLHVGHVRSYTALDVLARKKRMEGFNVLYPMGWDAFGLPTENYALKTGLHPSKITEKNIKIFKKQIKSLGLSFDWSREINTTDPEYYKWTQWIFLQFFKKGLAYQAEMPINWCPSCRIGLANEEVVEGKCERCGSQTEKRLIKQWLLKITKYADRLVDDLEKVDYLEKIKTQQINWIGRSEGVEIKFQIPPRLISPLAKSKAGGNAKYQITVFTTRLDTIFGVTAIAIAPEHPLVKKLTISENREAVEKYIKASQRKSEFERSQLEKEKTGVFTGSYCFNPVNNEKVPIWVSDFVVGTYGTGAVMLVPAHDKRDYQFAKKYGLEIREVVAGGDISKEAFIDYGKLVNSGQFTGINSKEAIEKISDWLIEEGLGQRQRHYHLRDWIFSRQHYWGEPIPLVFCTSCKKQAENSKFQIPNSKFQNQNFNQGELLNLGWVAVPEKELPVELPYVKKYEPSETGESPLSKIKDWVKMKCPKCGGPAQRETDTMPNWAGSSWYFLRYLDPQNNKKLADFEKIKYWLPIDLYNGGMEHTTLHLLYSRFWYKFLFDLDLVPTDEPYQRRLSHGMILAEDGRKMSKSFNNVINPDEIVKKYGADTLRLYEMFMGPYDQAINWNTKGILGCYRFLNRIWQIFNDSKKISQQSSPEILTKLHKLIKKVNDDFEAMKFNTAVAGFMEFINFWSQEGVVLSIKEVGLFLCLLAPLAPHLAEELWQEKIGQKKSIFLEKWPQYDPKLIKEKSFQLIIQINGRVRHKMEFNQDISEQEIKDIILKEEKIKKWLAGKEPKKIIYIANRLINLVV